MKLYDKALEETENSLLLSLFIIINSSTERVFKHFHRHDKAFQADKGSQGGVKCELQTSFKDNSKKRKKLEMLLKKPSN
ncbi:CLUMA_CG019956, isoform A [Clunio marinus]|uniref:CLUMA_CG019956, isoform A n=1 Tax=Clunio marinus TaxID=568069 RepID=A0A1J1J647_9DIPT|nr:CLUMA_CG019956, isoform A [Clunio marinus]